MGFLLNVASALARLKLLSFVSGETYEEWQEKHKLKAEIYDLKVKIEKLKKSKNRT